MLLIEKVLILKSSDTFRDTAESELVELAEVLKEEFYEPQSTLFEKGSAGNCMYFIYKGKVRIHDGDHTLAVLGEQDILGELSILDAESRSASATTMEDCILLKLEQEPFYEIMMNNIDVLKGILKTLSQRLRASNIKSVLR